MDRGFPVLWCGAAAGVGGRFYTARPLRGRGGRGWYVSGVPPRLPLTFEAFRRNAECRSIPTACVMSYVYPDGMMLIVGSRTNFT